MWTIPLKQLVLAGFIWFPKPNQLKGVQNLVKTSQKKSQTRWGDQQISLGWFKMLSFVKRIHEGQKKSRGHKKRKNRKSECEYKFAWYVSHHHSSWSLLFPISKSLAAALMSLSGAVEPRQDMRGSAAMQSAAVTSPLQWHTHTHCPAPHRTRPSPNTSDLCANNFKHSIETFIKNTCRPTSSSRSLPPSKVKTSDPLMQKEI